MFLLIVADQRTNMQYLKVLQRLFGGLQSLLRSRPFARHRYENSAASAAREAFFQPKDLVWLDSCDKHRNEAIKQTAAGGRNSTGLRPSRIRLARQANAPDTSFLTRIE
ncbi:hypothetical protein CN933_12295 [Sinorhizobium sp. M4_45]|nr:hypothetical protein CN933_12295 [Sinorhizobium sp. M4_45]